MSRELYARIPSITILVNHERGGEIRKRFGEGVVKMEIRRLLDEIRRKIHHHELERVPDPEDILTTVESRVSRYFSPIGKKAINATGILLHTGLGRAPFPELAVEMLNATGQYSILQTDLETGKRGLRETHVEPMLRELTGCEAATVVNNNAAATMLVLNSIAEGGEVIVSRGQLVEIGGSFRLPEVMEKSGVVLREIGATNQTHLRDYENAVNENTAAIIHVHTSNYRIRGFASTPDIRELRELRDRKFPHIPLIDDLGSGALVPLSDFGLPDEPMVRDSVARADVACFSGDKLICGAQSGIICGKSETINKIRKNPFARMFRVDKMTLMALESALIQFVNGTYRETIPFYRMLSTPAEILGKRADVLRDALTNIPRFSFDAVETFAYVGSGSIPDEGVPSRALTIKSKNLEAGKIADALRNHLPSIFCRISDNTIFLDMRTLFEEDVDILKQALPAILENIPFDS